MHVYAGGPAGSGALVVGAAAAALNERAVNVQCGTSGVAHRFVIPLSASKVAPHAGKRVYVHGISPSSNYPNATIFRSGWYRLPN